VIRRLWCAMFGHEWVAVWRAGARDRGKTMVFCHRCETPGWVL
jgi:hypothetical protein